MGKYSSASDSSDCHSSKKRSGRLRHRQSSSDSSSSSYRRYKKKSSKYKSKSRRRSRSRERYYKRSKSPSSSKSIQKSDRRSRDQRSHSKTRDRKDQRSRSFDRRSKSKDRRSKSRDRKRSDSKDKKYTSRSSSAEKYNRKRKSKSPKGKRISKFVDLTSDNEDRKLTNADPEVEAKLRKYFNANTTEFKDMSSNEDSNSALNDPAKFLQFSSKPKKVPDNIVIDLKSQTILVPEAPVQEKLTIFHPNLMLNEDVRIDKWVKDLYTFRQKAYKGEILIN